MSISSRWYCAGPMEVVPDRIDSPLLPLCSGVMPGKWAGDASTFLRWMCEREGGHPSLEGACHPCDTRHSCGVISCLPPTDSRAVRWSRERERRLSQLTQKPKARQSLAAIACDMIDTETPSALPLLPLLLCLLRKRTHARHYSSELRKKYRCFSASVLWHPQYGPGSSGQRQWAHSETEGKRITAATEF